MSSKFTGFFIGTFAAWLSLGLLSALLLWGPIVGPWVQERKGLANLRQAEQERRILVEQAQAEKDAASARAEAIAIVGTAAKEYPEYRQQEFIGAFAEAMQRCQGIDVIYVPTEANIPIMEASRQAVK
ncbi:MAG: hypothetical protein HRU11_09330 [Parvularculaceae bacterium]|nr:hypothetical protein [Parvularculaceae bacterium]